MMLPLLQVVGWSDGHLFEFTFQKTLINYANPVIGLFLGFFSRRDAKMGNRQTRNALAVKQGKDCLKPPVDIVGDDVHNSFYFHVRI